MNWKPGPAKTRDGREARIYAVDGEGDFPIHGAILKVGEVCDYLAQDDCGWSLEKWTSNGLNTLSAISSALDLLPPKLSRDEVAMVCLNKYGQTNGTVTAMRAALDHYDHLRKEGLCDE